jgi:hypothetical protein
MICLILPTFGIILSYIKRNGFSEIWRKGKGIPGNVKSKKAEKLG